MASSSIDRPHPSAHTTRPTRSAGWYRSRWALFLLGSLGAIAGPASSVPLAEIQRWVQSEPKAKRPGVDLSGTWTFMIGLPDERREVVLQLADGERQALALWHEFEGTRRYFAGHASGDRLELREFAQGNARVEARLDPDTGRLNGHVTGKTGSHPFHAQRVWFAPSAANSFVAVP